MVENLVLYATLLKSCVLKSTKPILNMKKLLLTIALFFSVSILVAQNFNQPTQFNNVCDDNNDGTASFWLGEITFEMNSFWYVVIKIDTGSDAA